MSENENIDSAASRLWQAALNKVPCQPVRDLIGGEDVSAAYQVQMINGARRLKQGAVLIGRKIGLTSLAVQQQLGVDQPDFGMLFKDMLVEQGQEIDWQDLMQPKVEAEVAFVLGKDITGKKITAHEIVKATDHVTAALEIVGSRIERWNIKIIDTIADNASASHFVMGNQKVKLEALHLPGLHMVMNKNGVNVSQGSGAACLGSPVQAVLWLAQTMADLGSPLRAGDLILSGALGPMATVAAGDFVSAEIVGLGKVAVNFGV